MDYGALLQATVYLVKLLILASVFVPLITIASTRSVRFGYLLGSVFVMLAVVTLFIQLNHLVTDRIEQELDNVTDSVQSEDEEPT